MLFVTALGSAATITSFTAGPDKNNNFTTDTINSTFTSNTANVTNSTITCNNIVITGPSAPGCSGTVADFELKGSDLNSPTPFSVTIDGTYDFLSAIGTASAVDQLSGSVDLTINGLIQKHYTFTASPSTTPFSKTLASETVPGIPGGLFDIVGTVSLSMPNGAELVLPSSLSLAIGAAPTVPEPAAMLLMGGGLTLVGLAGWRRRRRD